MALSEQYDLILMDIQMPHMNGYEATRMLRKKGIETGIIAVTAYAMTGDDQKCLAAGCNDYVSKPIDSRVLLNVIRKYMPSQQNEPVSCQIKSDRRRRNRDRGSSS